jgi:predicted nucleic acid-binding protein
VRRVYVETNFIVALAHGEHDANERVVQQASLGAICLALPQICLDEALSVDIKRRERIFGAVDALRNDVREYGRARGAPVVRAASPKLQSAIVAVELAEAERTSRMRSVIAGLLKVVRLIAASIHSFTMESELRRDPYDAIIASAIADDNHSFGMRSMFLTGNNDFDREPLKSLLSAADVERVAHPESLLAKLRAAPTSGGWN